MHFMSQLRYNPTSRRDEFYYRIKESFCDLTGRVRSRIMLNVGFINEDHQPEDIRDIGKCLTYLHEHQTHDRPVNYIFRSIPVQNSGAAVSSQKGNNRHFLMSVCL